MIKEKNDEILKNLCSVTISGNLKWYEVSTSNNKKRAYHRVLFSDGQDGTQYEIDIKYSINNDVFHLENHPSLWIRNQNLPNGVYLINSFNSSNIIDLRDAVKEHFCSDMNPSIEQLEQTLDEICKGISISLYRENKLNDIL